MWNYNIIAYLYHEQIVANSSIFVINYCIFTIIKVVIFRALSHAVTGIIRQERTGESELYGYM